MKRTIGLAACVLLIAAEGKDKEKKPEDAIQGTWKVVSMSANNKEQKPADDFRVVFTRNMMFYKQGERSTPVMRFKLDPTKKPAAVDFAFLGRAGGSTALGIYELKGDELKVMVPMDEQDRPTEFGPKAFVTYYTLQRDKPSKPGSEKTDSSKSEKKPEKSEKD
jgi:uncharacterized protein (TIGR03067 family)